MHQSQTTLCQSETHAQRVSGLFFWEPKRGKCLAAERRTLLSSTCRAFQISMDLSGCQVLLLPFCKAGLHSRSESLGLQPESETQPQPPGGAPFQPAAGGHGSIQGLTSAGATLWPHGRCASRSPSWGDERVFAPFSSAPGVRAMGAKSPAHMSTEILPWEGCDG